MAWIAGEVVEYRHLVDGRVWWRAPARVVEDTDELTALWWTAGTRYERPAGMDRLEVLRELADGRWSLQSTEWWGGDALHVVPRGAPFSIWPYRAPDGEMAGWYVNLQAPLVRTDRGFDTNDWTLDLVASSDLSTWAWKDEDELQEGERVGLYAPADVARIRAAGDEAVALVESRSPLFERWAAWRPDPSWTAPERPDHG